MAEGGRYIDDGKGNARRVDPKTDQHHEYAPAPQAKPAQPETGADKTATEQQPKEKI